MSNAVIKTNPQGNYVMLFTDGWEATMIPDPTHGKITMKVKDTSDHPSRERCIEKIEKMRKAREAQGGFGPAKYRIDSDDHFTVTASLKRKFRA